jgi:hypothetical protein
MRLRKLLAITAATTALFSAAASASPLIDLNGFTGPVEIKFQNYESFSSTPVMPGDTNFGVVQVTSIVDPNTGNNLWVQGQGGQFLSGVFNGITVSSVTATTSGFDTTATGGVFEFWLTSHNFNPGQGTGGYTTGGCAVGGLCYNGITNTGGIDALNLELVPGTTSGSPVLDANTLSASTDSLTLPISGSAEGFADITGGADAGQFAHGGFTTLFAPADMDILDDFCSRGQSGCAGPNSSNWELFSHDPVDAIVMPEPASICLLAGGLGLLAPWVRRRRNADVG